MAEKKLNSKNKSVNKNKSLSTLSNDELLEQILNKKKNKNSKNIKSKKAVTNNKTEKSKKDLSSEELLEQIMNKKRAKKSKSVSKKDLPKLKKDIEKKKINDTTNDEILDKILAKKNAKKSKTKKVQDNASKTLTEIPVIDLPKLKKVDTKKTQQIVDKPTEKTDIIKELPKVVEKKKTRNKVVVDKKMFQMIICIVIVAMIIVTGVWLVNYKNSLYEAKKEYLKNQSEALRIEEEKLKLKKEYDDCLKLPYSEFDETQEIIDSKKNLNSYLNSMKVSVQYLDKDYGFNYNYNSGKVYYAASTIKALDALYIYTKAAKGEINLDDTLVYSKKYKNSSSAFTGKLNVGEKVTIRDLVKYAVMVSDNGCHQMLIDYIGYSNLKAFGNSLGATKTLTGNDNFGYINTADGIIYMKNIDLFFETYPELGAELKSYFVNSDENGLSMDGVEAATKYGEYAPMFHNIGVVYGEHPYYVSILTEEKSGDFVGKVRNVNLKINDLHMLYYSNRIKVCHSRVYDK